MKRIVVSLVLMFLFFTTTTAVYAQIEVNDDILLDSISDYYLIDQRLITKDGAKLVPAGVVRQENDVYFVEYQYEVVVKQGMDLQVLIDDIVFSNVSVTSKELFETFQFEIEETVVETLHFQEQLLGQKVVAERVLVNVRVSMDTPQSYELYRELVGGHLSFEVYFFAV